MTLILLVLIAFAAAYWFTGRFRRYALIRQLLDHPNIRSSHAEPTPRGGGVAIVGTVLFLLIILVARGSLPWPLVIAALGGGAAVAFVGFRDDLAPIRPRWRLLGHFAAAAWALAWIPTLPALPAFGQEYHLGWIGYALAALYIVWLINLTNFMDGIDGIASIEVVTVSAGGVALHLIAGPEGTRWLVPLLLGSATAGFLVWNWPPAKIFMGDAGSGFLGFMLAVISLDVATEASPLYWSWVILLGAFVVDATTTLIRRTLRGKKASEAHRSHAYQHAAVNYRSHTTVTLAVAAINVGYLFPIALAVALGRLDGPLGAVVAYTPLVVLAFRLRAGIDHSASPGSTIQAPRS